MTAPDASGGQWPGSTPIHEEIHMYTRKNCTSGRFLPGAAAIVCTLFGSYAAAGDHNVDVAIHVSTQGLDLNRPADAHAFYTRLKNAAWVACTRGNRVNLAPVDDLQGCCEKALGDAIASVRAPMLTKIYLETHTLREAVTHGLELPAQLAAK